MLYIWTEHDELANQHFVVLSPLPSDHDEYDEDDAKLWPFPDPALARAEATRLRNIMRRGGAEVTLD